MNMIKHAKRSCAIIASALLMMTCFATIVPSQAFAIDETRTFTWANGSPQPEIPQTIIGADGREYRLTSQTPAQQAGSAQTTSQQFSRTESRQISPNQLGQVAQIMPISVRISENGYEGNISRTGIDTTPVYRTDNERITSTTDAYGDTEESAKAGLPQTINRNGRTLNLVDSTVEVLKEDSSGNPLLFKAIGTYALDLPRQVLDHYDVVAHYAGSLSKTVNSGDWTINAVYSAEDMPAQEPAEPTNNDDNANENNDAENEINMLPPVDMDGNTIDDSNLNANTNTNTNVNKNQNTNTNISEPKKDEQGLPILPIMIGAGIVLIGAILAIILLARKKKQQAATAADNMKSDELNNDADNINSLDFDAALTSLGGVGIAAGMPVIIEDPECQLIELITIESEDENGETVYDYEQKPKADLEIAPSCVADIPTVVYFPALEDEEGNHIDFVPTDGAQYWIAIDEETVQLVPNKDIIIVSDDDKEIYRGTLLESDGTLTDQLLLDTEYMTSIVNGTADEIDVIDVSEELERYDEIAENAMSAAESAAVNTDDIDDTMAGSFVMSDDFADADILSDDSFILDESDFAFDTDDIDDDIDYDIEELDDEQLDVSSLFGGGSFIEDEEDDFDGDFMSTLEDIDDSDDSIEADADITLVSDDEIDALFDNAIENKEENDFDFEFSDEEDIEDKEDEDPFAVYGFGLKKEEEKDNFDSEFEREMDDIEYEADLEPDVDDFDYEEDFQDPRKFKESLDMHDVVEDINDDIILEDELDGLDDLDFDDISFDELNDDDEESQDIKDFKDLLDKI